ncbi:MAG: hypothetical protein Q8O22_03610 [Candidatus Omnitrophota bacterium]|nr:hypothetical protein [Candidatus Omnitrophota bacterium]
MVRRTSMLMFCLWTALSLCRTAAAEVTAPKEPNEAIYYGVEPVGSSVYEDFGPVVYMGKTLNLTVFTTDVLGFNDTEKIYSDPDTGYPIRVERDVAMWLSKEYLTEDYSLSDCSVVINKFKDNKLVQEYRFKGSGPLDNAIIVPFSLRKAPILEAGWSKKIILPEEYIVKLEGTEEVSVPAGKFKAYHFISMPEKFEVWISADELRLPVKIKGLGGLGYTLEMKKRVSKGEVAAAQ